ncbi:MAG: LytR/AlgR family response regulator transcription factor [Polaribacter sp.]
MRNYIFFILFTQISYTFLGQLNDHKSTNDVINKLKRYQLKETNLFIEKISSNEIKKIFYFNWHYYKSGVIKHNPLKSIKHLSEREEVIYNYTIGDYYKNQWQLKDSLIYDFYTSAFLKAKKLKDTILINEALFRISNYLYSYHDSNLNMLKKYVNEYQFYANDSIDRYWSNYYSIVVKLAEYEKFANKTNIEKLDFKMLYSLAKNSYYLKGETNQLEGIYYNHFLRNPKKGYYHFRKAINNYEKENFYISRSRISGNRINIGITFFYQGKYEKAIFIFKEELKRTFNHNFLNDLKEELAINDWLSKSYKELKKFDLALYYSEEKESLQIKINKLKQALIISLDEVKQNVSQKNIKIIEKEKEIDVLENKNHSLNKNIYTLLPILGFTTLILIFIFYLYKRYKKRSYILEEEQSETLQKLDELKQIVIKNHIILKDKTKVYISELMYIQSDDHYLKVFTQHGKNHFVRGKLSQIKEELPPNFIQCHRSYIVNSNFIKQIHANSIVLINKEEIPLSRSYKGKF